MNVRIERRARSASRERVVWAAQRRTRDLSFEFGFGDVIGGAFPCDSGHVLGGEIVVENESSLRPEAAGSMVPLTRVF